MSTDPNSLPVRNQSSSGDVLPLELVFSIVDQLLASQSGPVTAAHPRRSLLVNQVLPLSPAFYSHYLPSLYHTVILSSLKAVELLSNTVREAPHLGDLIVNFWIRDPSQGLPLYSEPAGLQISALVLSLKNLERVALHHMCPFEGADISDSLPKLHTVRIHGHPSHRYIKETLPCVLKNIKFFFIDLPVINADDFSQVVSPGRVIGPIVDMDLPSLVLFEANITGRIVEIVNTWLEITLNKDKRIRFKGRDWGAPSEEDSIYDDWIHTE
ncbi:hypothetical protein BDV93DRAFT_554346 [Ceratobasidium sp. AG-I]|nr:hypothetical protein BDV93DRAFT_554346 [Ceratobasidium sp. AG-I]